jgi:hypothetical protein
MSEQLTKLFPSLTEIGKEFFLEESLHQNL